jgi:hypothetical protein
VRGRLNTVRDRDEGCYCRVCPSLQVSKVSVAAYNVVFKLLLGVNRKIEQPTHIFGRLYDKIIKLCFVYQEWPQGITLGLSTWRNISSCRLCESKLMGDCLHEGEERIVKVVIIFTTHLQFCAN